MDLLRLQVCNIFIVVGPRAFAFSLLWYIFYADWRRRNYYRGEQKFGNKTLLFYVLSDRYNLSRYQLVTLVPWFLLHSLILFLYFELSTRLLCFFFFQLGALVTPRERRRDAAERAGDEIKNLTPISKSPARKRVGSRALIEPEDKTCQRRGFPLD